MLGFLMFLNFATAGLGESITGEQGKLSISNLAPVLFLLIAGGCYLARTRSVNRGFVLLFGFFNVAALISFVIFMFRYGWQPNVLVLVFQDVEILFALLLVWYAQSHWEEFLRVAKWGIVVSTILSAAFGVKQFISTGIFSKYGFITFGMDDKSQAAVLFCCEAYILIRLYRGLFERLVAAVLLLMSCMTLSRLPVVFLPVIFAALVSRTRYGWLVTAVGVGAVAAIVIVAGDQIVDLFKIVDRLSSVTTATGDDSTSAHLLLLDTALQLKFSDALAFFFGTGPGNFSQALSSFPLDLSQLEAVDPELIVEARLGRAPMHSTPASLLLDYNIVLFLLLCFLFLRALHFLVRRRRYLDLSFFLSLFSASVFYSLHNKPYLFLAVATLAAALLPREVAAAEAPAADTSVAAAT